MPDIPMPRLSDSMEEGTIVRWLKAPGDEVAAGDALVEIETDKANMTYDSAESGPLEILAQEGDTVAVGEPIARIGGGSDPAPPTERAAAPEASPAPDPEQAPTPGPEAVPATAAAERPERSPGPRLKASPVARRIAKDLGVDLGSIQGSGPGGRIVKADVEARAAGGEPEAPAADAPAAASPAPSPAPATTGADSARGKVTTVDLTRTQTVVAQRMVEIKATVPDFQVTVEVAMDGAVALRERIKELGGDGPVPSLNDLVVKACALALRDHPRVNGAFRDGRFELYERINVGVAVAGDGSLIVPVIRDADSRSLGSIARETRRLAGQARDGTIEPPSLAGGTFTVSNLGMFGVSEFTAIVNRGQAAILAVGAVRDVAVVESGALRPGKSMSMTLSSDHRIIYGADAAAFLATVRELLERPLALSVG